MIERLRAIADEHLEPTPIDRGFYTHELREFVRYRTLGYESGTPADPEAAHTLWNNADSATLEDYGYQQRQVRCIIQRQNDISPNNTQQGKTRGERDSQIDQQP
jgi:hypothetical protein